VRRNLYALVVLGGHGGQPALLLLQGGHLELPRQHRIAAALQAGLAQDGLRGGHWNNTDTASNQQ